MLKHGGVQMKSDVNGCSICAKGTENYESFTTRIGRKRVKRIQYDYRHTNGKLFSCVAKTLEAARAKRDNWIKERGV